MGLPQNHWFQNALIQDDLGYPYDFGNLRCSRATRGAPADTTRIASSPSSTACNPQNMGVSSTYKPANIN
jgi:hypothetical protein